MATAPQRLRSPRRQRLSLSGIGAQNKNEFFCPSERKAEGFPHSGAAEPPPGCWFGVSLYFAVLNSYSNAATRRRYPARRVALKATAAAAKTNNPHNANATHCSSALVGSNMTSKK